MLKTFALIARRPDLTREAFREHYEEIHSPLALPLFEGLDRYVKYHLERDLVGHADFDVISTFWYESAERAIASQQRFDGPEGEPIKRDEATFMDQPPRPHPAGRGGDADRRRGGRRGVGAELRLREGAGVGRRGLLRGLRRMPVAGAARRVRGNRPSPNDSRGWCPTPRSPTWSTSFAALRMRTRLARWAQAETQRGASILAVATRLYESPADASLA